MTIHELQQGFAQAGLVAAILVTPARRAAVARLEAVQAVSGAGLEGDRYRSRGARQVTLIQQEHLAAAASYLGRESIDPSLARRNIVTQGINLLALKGRRFSVGNAILQFSGECHPCSRMEENLGTGGYNAMRGHGGITASIVQSGTIRIGDRIVPL